MDTVMALPGNIEVKENSTSYYWFDEEGILCAINKKAPSVSFEEIENLVNDLKQLSNNEKICMLMDVTYSPSSNKQTREYTAKELPKMIKALAMVCKSPISRILGYLFLAVVTTPFPAKMCATEQEAKDWLKQYL